MLTVLGPYILVAGLALWLNRLDAVQCRGRGFDPLVDGVPLVLISILYSVLLLATGRSLFSAVCAAGGALLLFAVNRLKLSQFKEPLVFVDFGLFAQMVRHPRFYLPFLFPLPVVAAIAVLGTCMVLLYGTQPPLSPGLSWLPRVMLAGSLLPAILLWVRFTPIGKHWVRAFVAKQQPSFDPNADFARFGLTGSLILHGLAHAHREGKGGQGGSMPSGTRSPHCVWPPEALDPPTGKKPHVLLVQAESFFDFRRADPTLDPSVYANFDRLGGEGQTGEMVVAAHGAYTMRTEFSVLTGIPNRALGSASMNPYGTAALRPVWSLAEHFRSQGYRTVCVHPYDLKFFRRDKVMPNLGFDELHGEALFSPSKCFGPYVSDEALADYLLELFAKSDEPLFVFAITIEAHGPWDGARFAAMAEPPETVAAPSWGDNGLAAYLTHLRNTDRMIGRLASSEEGGARPRVVGVYGDHVGCVPAGRLDSSNTDYLIWPAETGRARRRTIAAEELGGVLLETVRELTGLN